MFTVKREVRPYGRKYLRKKEIGLVGLTEELVSQLQRDGRYRTARAYGSVLRSVLGFFNEEDLPMRLLSGEFLRRYEEYMLLKGLRMNTVSFYMRNLRAIYNKGVQLGKVNPVSENLFAKVYTGIHITPKRSAREEDIAKVVGWLANQAENPILPEARPLIFSSYYFLFCFYARGMSYVDMAYLKKTDIREGRICYRRRKTGQLLELKLTPEIKSILSFFNKYVRDSIYLFPVVCRDGREQLPYESGLRLQNQRLKKLSEKIGLSTSLTTHVARHTWATIAKKENIPISVISESLGHRSEKTTSIYLGSFDR